MLGTIAVLAFGASTASAATTTAIGQTSATADYSCDATNEYDLQTEVASGTSFVVPAGNWIVTSWSTHAGANGGSMSSMFFRPADPGSYTVIGESPVESLAASMLNTFPVNIHVQGGDLLGFWGSAGTACATVTDQFPENVNPAGFGVPQPPAVGTTVTPEPFPGYLINISAALIPALPTSKDDCKNGGWKVYGVFKTQGDCVSFVASGAKNPPTGA